MNSESRKWSAYIALVLALCAALVLALAVSFVWSDVYHRIEHVGQGINLCEIYAQLARQPAQHAPSGVCP